ncbi:MAG TPA: hypothetical protein VME46_21870 [Acidimicrobiales bacterium]|nr:hypothetical protein [Acidimicrobiales bacterium]
MKMTRPARRGFPLRVVMSLTLGLTFENFAARDAEDRANVDDNLVGYFAMYGPVSKPAQTWHRVWSQGAVPVPNTITALA